MTADEAASGASRPSLIQRVSHALFHPGGGVNSGAVVQYNMHSSHYSMWQSPDLYTHDFRCRPTPWAPRGYGWPKKTSRVRMDYAPYGVRSPMATHAPALWPRTFREPCCDCGRSGHCDICGGHARTAPCP